MSAIPTSEAGKYTPIDWNQVHEQIQAILEPMATRVQELLPNVLSQGGKTEARVLPLFTYRDFQWPGEPELEAVVVGVDFEPSPGGGSIVIRGDICGDETGHTYYEVEEERVPDTTPAVLAAASEIAQHLSAIPFNKA